MNAGNLIENGAIDAWRSGVPSGGWEVKAVERTEKFASDGAAALFRPTKKSNAVLFSPKFKLKPSTKYILSFHYRSLDDNAKIRGNLEGVKGSAFSLEVPYIHREGFRVDHIFTTPQNIPAETRVKFIAGGNGLAVVDEVSLTPYERAWNRAVFRELDGDEVECVFTVGNRKESKAKMDVEMRLYDFFNKVLWSEKASVTLASGGEKSWSARFAVGDCKRYRAVLKYKSDNGISDEIWSYYNCDVTKGIRKEYDLTDAEWTFQRIPENSDPDAGNWKKITIPHRVRWQTTGAPDDCLYQTHCEIPDIAVGEQVIFSADSAILNPKLYVNGELAGEAVGRMPLRADISRFWRYGKKNEILLKVQSQQAEEQDKKNGGRHFILPYGAHMAGLLDAVRIESRPMVHTDNLKIETSLNDRVIRVKGVVANDSKQPGWYTVENSVMDGDKVVLSIPPKKFWLIPFEPMVFKTKAAWSDPHLYFPHDPYLYKLKTVVKNADGKVVDESSERFGFREITIKGKYVLINGKKAKFTSRLSAPHPGHIYRVAPENQNELMNRNFRALQQYVRLGMVYGREYPFMGRLPLCRMDIFDEMGFIVRSSFELNMAYTNMDDDFDDSPRFWDANRRYIEDSIRRLWNHPSIIEWDMENETFLCSTQHTWPKLYDEFQRLRDILRGNDRTRPLLHDSADPMGDGDIISLHYPIEVTRHFPPSKSFPLIPFKKGVLYSQLNLQPGAFVWNEERPLMLGEDLIDFREYPQSLSLFNDEFVYGQPHRRKSFAPEFTLANYKAMNDMLQMLGREYRKREVHVLTGWGCCIEAFKDELARDAIVVDQYSANFFSEEKVKRSFSYFHDPMNDFDAEIIWSFKTASDGTKVDGGSFKMRVEGGELVQRAFTIKSPKVDKTTPCVLELRVVDTATGKTVCERTREYRVFPKLKGRLGEKLKISLFDPKGETTAAFRKFGAKFAVANSTRPPKDCDLFIIGKNAVAADGTSAEIAELDEFVLNGGKVLVMEQEGRVENVFPYNPRTNDGMYWPADFVRVPDHPLARGIGNDDLKFWRGADQLVSSANYFKPYRGNAIAVFDGGSMSGFTNSPLLEIPWGKGCYILSQLKLTSKLDKEPVAGRILANIFDYARPKPYKTCDKKLLYFGGDPLRKTVDSCGADTADFESKTKVDGQLLLADAGAVPSEVMKRAMLRFVDAGGVLWLSGLNSENADAWSFLTGKIEFERFSNSNLIKTGEKVNLLPGVSNSDLYWTGVPEYDFYGKSHEAFEMGMLATNPPLPIKGAAQLVNHGALQFVKRGDGGILVDCLNWAENINSIPQRAPRIPSAIMTAFEVRLNPMPGDARISRKGSYETLDISKLFNLELNGTLPNGRQLLAGVPFDLKASGAGAVLLGSDRLIQPNLRKRFPNKTGNVKVGEKADQICVLLTAFNSYESGRGFGGGSIIAKIKVQYEDGTTSVLPIMQKVDCANLFETFGDLKRGRVAWSGLNPFTPILSKFTIWPDDEWIQTSGLNRIYAAKLDLPRKNGKIAELSFESSNQHYAVIIFAVSIRENTGGI